MAEDFTGRIDNRLLSLLSESDRQALEQLSERVELVRKNVLIEPGQPISHVYFPIDGCCSCVTVVEDGKMVETAAIGWEGFVGAPLLNGVSSVPWKCFIQMTGAAHRIPRDVFLDALTRHPSIADVLRRYSQVVSDQAGQVAACNTRHSVMQRCAKWLLASHDKMRGGDIPLTHELLAIMLGVRRASVTDTLEQLRAEGVISYARALITIKDRERLVAITCDCYGEMNEVYEGHLLTAVPLAGH